MIKKMLSAAIMASVVMLPLPAIAQDTMAEEEAAAAAGGGAGAEGVVLALLALAAVGAGVYVALDSEEDDAPVSP